MQRKKSPPGTTASGLARLVLVLALLFLVVALTAGLAGCLFQPVLAPGARCCFWPGAQFFFLKIKIPLLTSGQ